VREPPLTSFAARLIAWHRREGRQDLPWQGTRDPYAIWVSEIMLQQTQVGTVIPYYERFLARFPDLGTLALAPLDQVLACWSGLGYYARARNLHRAAWEIGARCGGEFPRDYEAIARLPGIGSSTAGAICAFAFGERRSILDGNVKRVLARYFSIDARETELWEKTDALLPERDIEAYTQALMDLGATVCTRRRPACMRCPLRADCLALNTGRIEELPKPRPRRPIPRRRAQWLILLNGTQVLLERRPPIGVWGGLWCFPEIPANRSAAEWCPSHYAVNIDEVRTLPRFEHGFTHFTLEIVPRLARVLAMPIHAAQSSAIWLLLDEALGAAVPSPVKRIVRELIESPELG
jgi:A/G-specific adenine glycosylase